MSKYFISFYNMFHPQRLSSKQIHTKENQYIKKKYDQVHL